MQEAAIRVVDKINSPEDVKKLNYEEMNLLASEIRDLIIKKVNAVGGQFGYC